MNGAILSTLVLGIFLTFYQFYILRKEQQWYLAFEQGKDRFPGVIDPQILAPLKAVTNNGKTLTVLNRQVILNSIETRLEELHDFNRYLVGLLIFLGLLGTFWGLSQTIGAIAGVVSGIDVGANDIKEAFQALKSGLQSPLQGMGTAFSSSMFGLASSLIVGFLDIQVGKGCKHFYQWLEEKLMLASHNTDTLPYHGAAYSQGMLEQMAENMSTLAQIMQHQQDSRLNIVKSTQVLTEKLTDLTELMAYNKKELDEIKHNQNQLQEIIKFLMAQSANSHTLNVRYHLEKLQGNLEKLLEEIILGRQSLSQEIRSEIRLVSKTISALANGQGEAS